MKLSAELRVANELLRCLPRLSGRRQLAVAFLVPLCHFKGRECSADVIPRLLERDDSVCDVVPVEIVTPSYGIKTLLEGVLVDGFHGVWLDGKVGKGGDMG